MEGTQIIGKNIGKNFGFSLAEILVALGITAALSMAGVKITEQMYLSRIKAVNVTEQNSWSSSLTVLFNNDQICYQILKDVNFSNGTETSTNMVDTIKKKADPGIEVTPRWTLPYNQLSYDSVSNTKLISTTLKLKLKAPSQGVLKVVADKNIAYNLIL
ncbi:MAG: hypothetical protein HQK51_06740, partial [Oligoflexia bacterium]|nr:hypothetical protein [Oligoflexia bacterium]